MFDIIIPCIFHHYNNFHNSFTNLNFKLINNIIVIVNNIQDNTFNIDIEKQKFYDKFNINFIFCTIKDKMYPGKARELGIKYSTSDYIVFLDADDLQHPKKLDILKYFYDTYDIDHILHLIQPTQFNFKNYNDIKKINFINYDIIYKYFIDNNDINFGNIIGKRISQGLISAKKSKILDIIWENIPSGEDKVFNRNSLLKKNKIIVLDAYLSKYDKYKIYIMKKYTPKAYQDFDNNILIFNPSWDHSEIVSYLLFYLKKIKCNITVIYDFTKKEGNYFDYFEKLYNLKLNKIQFVNAKSCYKHFKNSRTIIFLDNFYFIKNIKHIKDYLHKIIVFNHINKNIKRNVYIINLGIIPFNNCIANKKYLITNFFKPKIIINKFKLFKINVLIIGQIEQKDFSLLKDIPSNIIIHIVNRKQNFIKLKNKNIKYYENLSTEKLILLLQNDIHFIFTLFKKNSFYHQDRIHGIIPYAFSFGIPIITDYEFYLLQKDLLIFKQFVYNNYDEFKLIIDNLKIDNNYEDLHNKIIQFRDIKIKEQFKNLNKIFKNL